MKTSIYLKLSAFLIVFTAIIVASGAFASISRSPAKDRIQTAQANPAGITVKKPAVINKNAVSATNTVAKTGRGIGTIRLTPVYMLTDKDSCLPCHGSEKFANNPARSALYINEDNMRQSLHKNLRCIDCHMDLIEFAQVVTSPDKKLILDAPRVSESVRLITDLGFSHSDVGRKVYLAANLSCRNCKEHRSIALNFDQSAHSFKNVDPMNTDPNQKKPPFCGDCHDSHYVSASVRKNAEFRTATRANAKILCGGCHKKEYESYDDTYHGRPYKNGSEKAPTCWDCHSSHNVKVGKDPTSSISSNNLVSTCGGCHEGCDETFAGYSPVLHGRQRILSENPVVRLKDGIFSWIYENITVKVNRAFIDPTQRFFDTKYNEYLRERDKAVTVPTRTN
jgi:hypothetical protein